jgi:hypothetical protein
MWQVSNSSQHMRAAVFLFAVLLPILWKIRPLS